jgi:protein involved in polysaccharide export with SLBB domain
MRIGIFYAIIILTISPLLLLAQIPQDLSKMRSSQITDDQLLQIFQQAKSSGQSEDELLKLFKQRGLPDSEVEVVSARLRNMPFLRPIQGEASKKLPESRTRLEPINASATIETPVNYKIFGTELFSNSSPLFVPNLNIATPLNYPVGPGDELLIEVYGNNVFSQKLLVSPEGFINIRYAGLINVNGVTIESLTQIVKKKLSEYIPSMRSDGTKLQISLGNVRSISVSVIGAVKKPGTITITSLATLFNALYFTGGPLENGSFRTIELIRDNKRILVADLYEYLTKGNKSANVILRENDLIRVPYAKHLVQLSGRLNREGIFEFLPSESLSDIIEYAGGFKSDAFKSRITGTRNSSLKREVIDVSADEYNEFKLQHGDSLHVGNLVDKFSNRVTIEGAVYKPGVYSWVTGQQLKDLISKASGLKEDAFLAQANVLRTYDNLDKENFSVNLSSLLRDQQKFELKNDDVVTIYSIRDLKDSFFVSIYGEVRNPGIFSFADSLTLKQLILQAGGLKERSVPTSIEVARLRKGTNPLDQKQSRVDFITADLGNDLSNLGRDLFLQSSDIVFVKSDPSKLPQQKVILNGEVLYPGTYVLQSPQERLNSIIARAGGFLPSANRRGVKVLRTKLIRDTTLIKRIITENVNLNRDSLNSSFIPFTTEIAVSPLESNKKFNLFQDFIIEDGDEIVVPKIINTISIDGEVLNPVSIQYSAPKSLNYYINSAGGLTDKARKSKIFLVSSNGSSKKTKKIIGLFIKHPKVIPGDMIIVPEKKEKLNKFDSAKAGILISALSVLVTTVAVLKGL